MGAQHTPGPWEIDHVDLSSWHILGPTNGFFADVLGTINDTDTLQGEANARLIAAAPDGLELAQEFLAFAESGAGFCYPLGSLQKLRAFVSRARGEA